MKILGINAYHGDSSAALVVDGQLIAAAEEERFRRIKHWAGVPTMAAQYCLSEGGLGLSDLDAIALNQDVKANFWSRVAYTLRHRPDIGLIIKKLKTRRDRTNIGDELAVELGQDFRGELVAVEHHRAHLASGFFVSPFDQAAVISVDGFGDFASTAWGFGQGNELNIDGRVLFPHSLGTFYQAMTQYLGFKHYGDEYKVMGLAPYGKPTYVEPLREAVKATDAGFELNLDYFRHHTAEAKFEWHNTAPVFDDLYSNQLDELLGVERHPDDELTDAHWDLAHSAQAIYEEMFFHLLGLLYESHPVEQLVLAGGCAMNSVANGKVYRRTPFTNVYIQAAAGDAGGAIGAAMACAIDKGSERSFQMNHAYWGPGADNAAIESLLTEHDLVSQGVEVQRVDSEAELLAAVSQCIQNEGVVGWYQGRMEWGPRALGARSILGDPRNPNMKEVLNRKIKRRESFRPFAPVILRECVAEWFEEEDDVPFMMQVFQISEKKRELIPAVTHVDGSGRLQTVTEADNGRYYRLIKHFQKDTGVPVLLNTSFNENEPIVCYPAEALDCFLRTGMDMLVMEDWLLTRGVNS